MGRIGKMPVEIPGNVNVDINGQYVIVKGPLGEESIDLIEGISVIRNDDELMVDCKDEKKMPSFSGLFRSLLKNMVIGVTQGFEKDLELIGIGYRAIQQGKGIEFQLGFSHNINFQAPEGITLEVVDVTNIKVKGINKQLVGQVAANIKKLRPPEPYKGKGIRYKGEYIRKKAGKTGK